jgi:hypothetical protein
MAQYLATERCFIRFQIWSFSRANVRPAFIPQNPTAVGAEAEAEL